MQETINLTVLTLLKQIGRCIRLFLLNFHIAKKTSRSLCINKDGRPMEVVFCLEMGIEYWFQKTYNELVPDPSLPTLHRIIGYER